MELELGQEGLLLLLVFSPLLGIILLASKKFSDKVSAGIAIFSSVVTLILSVVVFSCFDRTKVGFQMGQNLPWLPEIGLNFSVGIDGLSLWLLLLTSFLTFLVLVSYSSVTNRLRGYLINILFLEIGMLGTFVSLDVLQFYVFWELMLVPMYFLIGIWGGKNRIYASVKFVIYTALGSLLMLVAIAYLEYQYAIQFKDVSFYLNDLAQVRLTQVEEIYLFLAFALAFLIKVPVFPFHTWLPDAHVEAPTGGSVILAGVLLKMGIFGLVRYGIVLFPYATVYFAPYLTVLGIIGIVFGALVAWVQTDIKKLVAYSSVSHMGFCVLGFSMLNPEAFQGALIQLLNHGISTAALFFLVGVLYDRTHTREISAYGGIASKVPLFSFVFMVFMLSSIGLPLTNGFVGEFLILLGSFKGLYSLNGSEVYNLPITILCSAGAVLGVVLGALYMISLYRRVVFGKLNPDIHGLTDLSFREIFVFTPLLILVFLVGLYPNFILRDLEGTTNESLRILKARSLEMQSHIHDSGFSQVEDSMNLKQS
jgi:NADH-quinone oxidoreductase subunit M